MFVRVLVTVNPLATPLAIISILPVILLPVIETAPVPEL
jgi:hypothetical protein